MQDLSNYHQLIGQLFSVESPIDVWEEFKIDQDQVDFFNEWGYLSGIKILDEPAIEILRNELVRIADPDHPGHQLLYEYHSNESTDPGKVLFHSLGHWRISEAFHDVLWNPRFVVVACQLLGNRAIRFWHDQLFCKPANHGGVVAWHQDYSYWTRTEPMQHLTCWVGLDDASKENGCLQYIPGSHRWDLLQMTDLGGSMDGIEKYLNKEQIKQFGNKVAIEMEKGYGSFHHPLMVHGSYENTSNRPRRAFVINVFADGTKSVSEESLLSGVPPVKPGENLDGRFFPILFVPEL